MKRLSHVEKVVSRAGRTGPAAKKQYSSLKQIENMIFSSMQAQNLISSSKQPENEPQLT